MLSYQHIYHAANMADVHKHLWLIAVLRALKKGDTPLFWLDTHGGRGLYDLGAPEAQKLAEYRDGFLKFRDIASQQKNIPPVIRNFFELVESVNKKRKGLYPGSALIAARMLGPKDELHVCEMHKGEIEFLKKSLKPFPFAKIYKEDGYAALARLLPLAGRNGGVLIDPSYEVKTEYIHVLKSVKSALAGSPQSMFLIWYPLLPAGHHKIMSEGFSALKEAGASLLIDEWIWSAPGEKRGLYGSGMVVINPPYGLEGESGAGAWKRGAGL